MTIATQTVTACALGIALAACCGFRVFVPMLIAGLACRFHFFHFSQSFAWLSSTGVLICIGVATVIEIAGYYVPFIDNLLDTISAPLATVAGTLLATSVIPIDNEWMKWIIGIIAGGGGAGVIASGTGLLRLLSSKTTLGTGNPVVSTSENVAAVGGSLLSFAFPLIMATVILILLFWIMKKLYTRFFIVRSQKSESQ